MPPKSKSKTTDDIVPRGIYGSSPLGTTLFVGLRLLDGFILQRALQLLNPLPSFLTRLGYTTPPPPPPGPGGASLSVSTHGLTPFQAVLWVMYIGAALKHSLWVTLISKEQMPVKLALIVSFFNTLLNGVSNLAFSVAAVNPTWSERLLYASIPLYVVGIGIETVSEVQRRRFKDDERNKGKPFSGGLFGYARSINYLGYTLWRTAVATAGGGWVMGVFVGGWFVYDFTTRAIPVLDEYCADRYGVQWAEVKRKVPYGFFPGLI